jgi:hypothetical protein
MSMPLNARVGWRTILKRTFKEVIDDNCLGLAAQLAYYFFLSLFPALLVVVALTSFFPYRLLDGILRWFATFTPPDVLDIIEVRYVTKAGNAGLLTFGILSALWGSSSAMSAIIDTLNRAYSVKSARGRGAGPCRNSDRRSERVHARVAHARPGWTNCRTYRRSSRPQSAIHWTWKIFSGRLVSTHFGRVCAGVLPRADAKQRDRGFSQAHCHAAVVGVSIAFRFVVNFSN